MKKIFRARSPKEESRRVGMRRLPEMPSLNGLGVAEDSETGLESKRFGEGLIRDIADRHHREDRRSEGVYCPHIERKVRHLTNHYNLHPLRARVVAGLMGGGK